jgi:hypothetical protein
MSDAIENKMHSTPPELTQIAANFMLFVCDGYIMLMMKNILLHR